MFVDGEKQTSEPKKAIKQMVGREAAQDYVLRWEAGSERRLEAQGVRCSGLERCDGNAGRAKQNVKNVA